MQVKTKKFLFVAGGMTAWLGGAIMALAIFKSIIALVVYFVVADALLSMWRNKVQHDANQL